LKSNSFQNWIVYFERYVFFEKKKFMNNKIKYISEYNLE